MTLPMVVWIIEVLLTRIFKDNKMKATKITVRNYQVNSDVFVEC